MLLYLNLHNLVSLIAWPCSLPKGMQNLSYLARVLQSSASNMELIENLCELGNLSTSDHEILALSSDSFTDHHDHQPQSSTDHDHHQLPMNFSSSTHDHNYNIQSYSHSDRDPNVVFVAHSTAQLAGDFGQQSEKEKPSGGRKRKRNNVDKEVEKPKEVIHVRAKRGQATDSHSLAERVRREKINERLRCLQNLVPGCYKTMGMAVMLDVVISYVQSLQNQIEFLSMKLSAASVYYDFNSPVHVDAVDAMQGTNAYEVQEDMIREGEYGGGLSNYNHSTWPL